MTFTLKRKNIEGAMSLGIIPKSAQPVVHKILDAVPDVHVVDITVKAFDSDGKEIEIGAIIKMKLMAAMMSGMSQSEKKEQ